jgi:hypothetical protein
MPDKQTCRICNIEKKQEDFKVLRRKYLNTRCIMCVNVHHRGVYKRKQNSEGKNFRKYLFDSISEQTQDNIIKDIKDGFKISAMSIKYGIPYPKLYQCIRQKKHPKLKDL